MKNLSAILLLLCLIVLACNATNNKPADQVDTTSLSGSWELDYIEGSAISLDSLYPNKKPTLVIDVATARVSGQTGCNNYNGPLVAEGNTINFTSPMAMTKMFCEGGGESAYMNTLQKVSHWTITQGDVLNLIMGDIAVMRFKRV